MNKGMIDGDSNMWRARLGAVGLCLVLAGCSGEGSGDFIKMPGSGGTGSSEPVFSVGIVNDSADLMVSSVRYSDDAVIVTDDAGSVLPKSEIATGMVVELNGVLVSGNGNGDADNEWLDQQFPTSDSLFSSDGNAPQSQGRADFVRLKSQAIGPVEHMLKGGFVVNGMIVGLGSGTRVTVDGALVPGKWVEVFGLIDPSDDIVTATLVRSARPGKRKLTGVVDSISRSTGSLQVSGQQFDIGGASLPAAGLQEGSIVLVYFEPGGGAGDPVASDVRPANRSMPGTGAVGLEGIVGQYQSVANFSIRGITVNAAAATVKGVGEASLSAGARVQILGRMNQGEVIASRLNVLATDPGVNVVVGSN